MLKNTDKGIGKLTFSVFALLIGSVLYCGYKILPFYYYYFELVNHMEQVIKVASTETDQEIRKKLLYHIKKMQIPAKPDDLKILRDGHHMIVELKYEEVFFVTWKGKDYDLQTFKFDARAEGDF